ncbi:MAG: hypothetical protein COB98_10240, partial [Flavobacteriaceae bacterium]
MPPLAAFKEKSTTPQDQYLYISTPSTTSIDVTITPVGGTPVINTISNANPLEFNIGVGFGTQLFVDSDDTANKIVDKGFIVHASSPVYVSVRLNVSGNNSQAGQIVSKGIAGLGTVFRLGSFVNAPGLTDDLSSIVSVMASEDNTSIKFSNFKTGVIIHNNGPKNIVLNKGESYIMLLKTNLVSANEKGLIGVQVKANKPIVVNCGSFTGTNDPTGTNGRDIGVDQIVSIERTGTEYVFIKGSGVDMVERVLIVAHEDDTKVYKDNQQFVKTLNAGEFLTFDGTSYSGNDNLYVSTSKKVFAYQGIGGDDRTANQAMFFVPPLSCHTPKVIENLPFINKIGNREFNGVITLITEVGATVLINDSPITTSPKSIIGNTDFVTYIVSGLTGHVSVKSDRQVYVASYGMNGAATYGGYYSGFIFEPKIVFDIPDLNASGNCIPNVELSLFDNAFYETYQWFFDGEPIQGATSQKHTPSLAGYYRLEGGFDGCTENVFSENIPVSLCPNDLDGDGIADNVDVDIDNDGIFNTEESHGDFALDFSNVLTGSLAITAGPTLNYTGVIEVKNNTIMTPIIGGSTGVISSKVTSNDGNNLSEVSYTLNFDTPLNLQFEYVSNTVLLNDELDDQEYFILKVPADKTITVLDPDNQLLIDVNYDGVFDDNISEFSAFEIYFKLNSSSLIAGAGTFKFRSHSVSEITYTHINKSETRENIASFKISAMAVDRYTDSDMLSDAMDGDSDNDGCFDVVEAGFTDVNDDGYLGGIPIIVNAKGAVTSGVDGYVTPSPNYILLPTLVIDVQPAEFIDGCQEADTSVEVTVANADSYQWQKSTDGGTTWIDVVDDTLYSGTTTNKLRFTKLPLSVNLTKYRVKVIGAGNGCGLLSDQTTLTVAPYVTASFTTVGPICKGETIPALPTTSVEFMIGTWSPALDNTKTTTYTFSPVPGQCANPTNTTMTIVINPIIIPTFSAVPDICEGNALALLPLNSIEGITGTWLPALDNTKTTRYTFTPNVGQCVPPTKTELTIVVHP